MAADPPTASVIVPSYNRPSALRQCVDALALLDYPASRLEVVVVDDGSPQPLPFLSGPKRPTVTVIRQENKGPAAARNRGALRAAGEIIAFTDDDCRPRPGWLRHLVSAITDEPSALVGGRTLNALHANPFAAASQDLVNFLYDSFFDTDTPRARAIRPFVTSNNMAVRRQHFLDLSGFDETFCFSAGEDRDLCERWASNVGPLRLTSLAIVDHYHRLTPSGFLRQHFLYGRGAMHLYRQRGRYTKQFTGFEPASFYLRMLRYPFTRHSAGKGALGALLVAISQAASLAGILAEAVNSSIEDKDADGPRTRPARTASPGRPADGVNSR